MTTFNSLQMSNPPYPVSGPTGDGRSIQGAHGVVTLARRKSGSERHRLVKERDLL